MRQNKHFHPHKNYHGAGGGTNSSSSAQEAAMSGMVDIVDSSDERYTGPKIWISRSKGKVMPQDKPRDMLLGDLDMDDDMESIENAQMRAGDFKLMAQMPTSIGGHFKFTSEKNWDTEEVENMLLNSNASDYFTLNLKLLNAGLKSIPFYKRMDYSPSMFTKEQKTQMDKAAEEAETLYQAILKEHETNPNPRIKINSASRQSDSAKSKLSNKTVKSVEPAGPDELDELLSATTEQVATIGLSLNNIENIPPPASSLPGSGAASVVSNKNDIQEWLDNVLDE